MITTSKIYKLEKIKQNKEKSLILIVFVFKKKQLGNNGGDIRCFVNQGKKVSAGVTSFSTARWCKMQAEIKRGKKEGKQKKNVKY